MKNIPHHIAIIPDGNRRWARKHGIRAWRGHAVGAERFEEIAELLFHRGISYVTFWAASEDNLTKRSGYEVNFLLSVLQNWLAKMAASGTLIKNKIRFRMIGHWEEILGAGKKSAAIRELINELERTTAGFREKNLTILFGYDGRREMIEAVRKIKDMAPEKIDYECLGAALWTGALPPVDLAIRTGGEPHWSAGFMMWHTADSQFYFTKTLWPDFGKKEMEKALDDFLGRERRFGK
jgi:undecaprenyl diphosphate synthase